MWRDVDSPTEEHPMSDVTRRDFVKTSSLAAAAISLTPISVLASGRRADTVKVGVIGCGGRGTGAAVDCLTADPGVQITAMGDVFADRLKASKQELVNQEEFKARIDVPEERSFTGFDSYRRVLDSGVDLVILATPPHFRPMHFEAAIRAGKHVFFEKPVAVDPAGIRRVLAAAEVADSRKLCVVAGTQRRHQSGYLAAMEHVKNGKLGEIVSARCYWNQGGLWVKKKEPNWSDMEWQLRNWLYFTWVSGDHIVEQHVHNLDVMNWAIGAHPLKASGMGGRQVRTAPEYGHIFDHFAIEYEYPRGIHVLSMCRQIDGTDGKVEEVVHGTFGTLRTRPGFAEISGQNAWKFDGKETNPYVQEHIDLLTAIRTGKHLNEARQVAESTLTAIMGRMAAYTGKSVTWEQALASKLDLTPPSYDFGPLPVAAVAMPGRTPLE
jgi:predicted dehydrogenase